MTDVVQPTMTDTCRKTDKKYVMLAKKKVKIDPRVKRTRSLLHDALLAMLEEKDFDHITVGDIATRAGVNRTTFYDHFEDKYALVNHVMQQRFQSKIDNFVAVDAGLSEDGLRLLLVATCEFLREFVNHCAPSERKNLPPVEKQIQVEMFQLMKLWLPDSIEASQGDVIANALSWVLYGTALQWAQQHDPQDLESLADQVLPLIVSGLDGVLVN